MTILQNHHFYPLLALIQTFSKMRVIFHSATSQSSSESAASDVYLFLTWLRKTKQKTSKKIAVKTALTTTRLTFNSTFFVKFLYTPIPILEELPTLSIVWGWSGVY